MTTLQTALQKLNLIKIEDLISFIKTDCPNDIIWDVFDVIEKRVSEVEFLKICDSI